MNDPEESMMARLRFSPDRPAVAARRPVPLPLLLAAGGLITAVSLGARSTFGLFLDPVITTLGTGRGTFALAIAIQNLAWGLTQPFAGAVADRYGSARVLCTGAVVYAGGLVLLANVSSSGALYLSVGFIVGVGIGIASFAVVLAAVGRMVTPARRSMAMGMVSAMGSVGQFVLVPVIQRLIRNLQWEHTALVLAGVVLLVVVAAPVLRGRSADQLAAASAGSSNAVAGTSGAAPAEATPLTQELRRAAHSRSYQLLNLAFFVCGFHVTFVGTHLISYAKDIGQTRSVAAAALSLIGLFNIAGSLAAGALGSRHSSTKLLSLIYGSRAVVFTLFMVLPHSNATTLAFGAAIGLLWLSTVPLTSSIVVGQFGPTHVGTLFGIVFLSHQLGAFVGAYLGGTLADRIGSYNPVWWIAAGLGVMAAVVHLFIDEGPQPEAPVAIGLSPRPIGSMAAVAVVAGLSVTMGLSETGANGGGAADRSSTASADDEAGAAPAAADSLVFFCPLHTSIGSS